MKPRAHRLEPKKESHTFVPAEGHSYLVFNKPFQVLCQFTPDANSDKRTLAEFNFPPHVYSVGRLDYDSEGMLIMSNDGRLNKQLLDPTFRHDRVYLAQVENTPTEEQLTALRAGVVIDGDKTLPAQAELISFTPFLPERSVPIRFRKNIPTAWLKLTLCEGKNRQVRRMTAAIGCPTLRLMRVAIGRLDLFSLAIQPGEWLNLSAEQVASLFEPASKSLRIPKTQV